METWSGAIGRTVFLRSSVCVVDYRNEWASNKRVSRLCGWGYDMLQPMKSIDSAWLHAVTIAVKNRSV